MANDAVILLVEDNEDDVFLMRRAFREAGIKNEFHLVENGQAVVDYLSGTGEFDDRKRYPVPSVIFLDLKLPLKSGHEVLSWIRRQEQFKSVVVVVLTSSDMPTDIKISYQLGANSYLVKPPTAQQLLDLAKAFKCYWLEHNQFEDSHAGG